MAAHRLVLYVPRRSVKRWESFAQAFKPSWQSDSEFAWANLEKTMMASEAKLLADGKTVAKAKKGGK